MIDYAKDLDKLTATSKPPTPEERLREAVGDYLAVMKAGGSSEASWTAFLRLKAVYNEDPRPCINAAVKVERKPWWRFW